MQYAIIRMDEGEALLDAGAEPATKAPRSTTAADCRINMLIEQ